MLKNKSDKLARKQGCFFDEKKAEQVCNFAFNYLKIENGEQFTFLEWFKRDIVYPLFGWRMPDGSRRFQTVHVFVPRGNGKTYGESALALALQIVEDHAGETTSLIAPTTKQGEISYSNMQRFIGDRKIAECVDYKKQIRFGKHAEIRVLAAENTKSARLHGYTGPVILDELHGINQATFDAAKTTARKSKNPLLLTISTAGENRRGVAWDVWQDCQRIHDGSSVDIHTLPVLYALGEEEDWEDFSAVLSVNPGVDELGNAKTLRIAHSEALAKQTARPAFLRLNCNRWQSLAGRWLDVERWNSLHSATDEEKLGQLPCYLGLDLSKRHDLTCLVALWHDREAEAFYTKSLFWLPNRQIEDKETRDEAKYREWAKEGDIELVNNDTIDQAKIKSHIEALSDKHSIQAIGFDPALSTLFTDEMESAGFTMQPIWQGRRLTDACNELETRLTDGSIQHDGNRVMQYCVENVCLKEVNGGRYPTKENDSSPFRIDGVAALVIAIKTWLLLSGQSQKKSISADALDAQLDMLKELYS
jgi:phage terminase large subunit-like protein